MILSRGWSVFLVALAGWSWLIWPTFLRNIWGDPRSFTDGPTAFLVVHGVLTAVSLAIGTAAGVLGVRGLRAARPSREDARATDDTERSRASSSAS